MRIKTEPKSVRFDYDVLDSINTLTGKNSPQKALDHLQELWRQKAKLPDPRKAGFKVKPQAKPAPQPAEPEPQEMDSITKLFHSIT